MNCFANGNGFKTRTMHLGADVIVFTYKPSQKGHAYISFQMFLKLSPCHKSRLQISGEAESNETMISGSHCLSWKKKHLDKLRNCKSLFNLSRSHCVKLKTMYHFHHQVDWSRNNIFSHFLTWFQKWLPLLRKRDPFHRSSTGDLHVIVRWNHLKLHLMTSWLQQEQLQKKLGLLRSVAKESMCRWSDRF